MGEVESDEKPSILIVDDERGPRESLCMILTPTYNVLQAENGAQALEMLHQETVDLVTLDLNMPGMKGEDVMRSIRSDFPNVQIIVITGCGTVESAADGIRIGISDYLQKPFDVVQVTATVNRTLKRHRARQRLVGFLSELGEVVGHTKDAGIIMNDVQRSQNMRGHLGMLFEDGAANDGVSVVRYTGKTWDYLMPRGFNGFGADDLSIRVFDGIPTWPNQS